MSYGIARGDSDHLFCRASWSNVEVAQMKAMDQEIDSYHSDKFLNTTDDALVAYFQQKYRLDVPMLSRDAITVDQRETQIDVSRDPMRFVSDPSRPYYVAGTLIEVEIPFDGDKEFFFVQPTTFSMNPPRGEVRGSSLFLRMQGTNLSATRIKEDIDRSLAEIESALVYLRNSAQTFNAAIARSIQEKIAFRKRKILSDRNLVANLGFRMKEREGASKTYASPQVQRKIIPRQPTASAAPFMSEPILPDEHYDSILDIMSNMVRVMECSPSAFAHSDEEAIRTHFLMQLNGKYQGEATGETFNYEGKTDILIKDNGRNIFIAECKFWRGEKGYAETIDQLLGYLTWRDTKSAIVIFNRNKGFSEMLAKVKATTELHPHFRKFIKQRSETSWVYRFAHRDDPNREMTITVMVFDVPSTS